MLRGRGVGEGAGVIGGLELLKRHAKLPARAPVEHFAALFAAKFHDARLRGDGVHGVPSSGSVPAHSVPCPGATECNLGGECCVSHIS